MGRQSTVPDQRKIRVLIVEDDRFTRMVAAKTLSQRGYQVIEAVNGRQALALFGRIVPDLVLLDVEMPHINGIQVCQQIRKSAIGKSIPILMLTSREDQTAIEQSFAAGASDYLCKPVNWNLVTHKIPKLLETAATCRQARRQPRPATATRRLLNKGSWRWIIHSNEFQCSAGIRLMLDKLPEQATLEDFLAFLDDDARETIKDQLYLSAARQQNFSAEYRIDTARGPRHFQMQGRLVQERPAILEGSLQDITDRRAVDESVRRLAYQDALTRLANKPTFINRTDQAIRRAEIKKNLVAVLYIDLDDFREVNEKLGHNLGDQLLVAIGKTIKYCIRSSDAVSEIREEDISRIGGDKFAVLLDNLEAAETAGAVAKRILDELESPESETRGPLKTSASIGISLYPRDAANSTHLLARAEEAMRYAKLTGKHYFRYYDARMNSPAYNHLGIEKPLKNALKNNEFELLYQPRIDIGRGVVTGVEALIRWRSSQHGVVSPERFIPIAEKLGIMAQIDQWVLETACAEAQCWQDKGLAPISLSVNLSNARFFSHTFAADIEYALEKSGFPAEQLVFELLENSVMKDAHATTRRLLEIREQGCRVALDNFGAGLSSINYLKRFDLDYLKIDRQFLRNIMEDKDDQAIILTIMEMARGLGIEVIAQGVETRKQLQFLKSAGCRLAQGFLFARPLTGDQIFRALARRAEKRPTTKRV